MRPHELPTFPAGTLRYLLLPLGFLLGDRGPGRPRAHNSFYRLRLLGFSPSQNLFPRAHEIPQRHEIVAASRAAHSLDFPEECPHLT